MTEQQLADLERMNWDAAGGYDSDVWVDALRDRVTSVVAEVRRLRHSHREKDAEIARLREQIAGHCERIAKQSELLSRKAESRDSSSDPRDWLVLSKKNTDGNDRFVWYRTGCSGYTADIMFAGRYTKAEAKRIEATDITLAVPLEVAYKLAITLTVVANSTSAHDALAEMLKAMESKEQESAHHG